MNIEVMATVTAAEVMKALQSMYPSLCEGEKHKIFRSDYKGQPTGDALKDTVGAVVIKWIDKKEVPEKAVTEKKKKGFFSK